MTVEVLNNVPDSEVGNNVELNKASGATIVTVTSNKDGTSDISATFPNEGVEDTPVKTN